ncbi:MAG: cell division protein ZipA C-terminal FtsZ-binding domain-containing protein [Burkholderiales bacterium]
MTDFQIGLMIAGAAVIAAVLGYNYVQENRARKHAEKSFGGSHDDALLNANALLNARPAGMDQRIEPSFSESAFGDTTTDDSEGESAYKPSFDFSPESPTARPQPTIPLTTGSLAAASHVQPAQTEPIQAASGKAQVPAPPTTVQPAALNIDDKIDLVAAIIGNDPIPPRVLMDAIAKSRTFGKPVYWEGLQNGSWGAVQPDVPRYKEIKSGLQLVDRKGAMDEIFIGQFIKQMQEFASGANAVCQIEAKDAATRRAQEADQFAASVDIEIGVNVVSRSGVAFQGTKVRALCEAAGLKLDPDSGVFQSTNERGEPQFVLANLEPRAFTPEQIKNLTTQGLTILLDVPRVADSTKQFQHMMQLARTLADGLGGEVVDDARKPLTNTGAEAIRMQLAEISRRMTERGIPAGSRLAQRLFS